MTKQEKLDQLYLDLCERISLQSFARRLKVGALIVHTDNIVSMGWNGTPAGADNNCEEELPDGTLKTVPDVLHAESNALMKLAANPRAGAQGGTLYVTDSPCAECAKLIVQAKIARVVYRREYRIKDGVDLLRKYGVKVDHLPNTK